MHMAEPRSFVPEPQNGRDLRNAFERAASQARQKGTFDFRAESARP